MSIKLAMAKEEKAAINGLKQLAKKWPKTLWLFSASGTLCVMRKNDNGQHATMPTNGVDPAYILETINIENDGGDW
ncbi:MAG: hypothetical protein HQK65_14690 [Desulfamplus sp.]|nr:hypothetical protein [Desulfamplus sp.]